MKKAIGAALVAFVLLIIAMMRTGMGDGAKAVLMGGIGGVIAGILLSLLILRRKKGT